MVKEENERGEGRLWDAIPQSQATDVCVPNSPDEVPMKESLADMILRSRNLRNELKRTNQVVAGVEERTREFNAATKEGTAESDERNEV